MKSLDRWLLLGALLAAAPPAVAQHHEHGGTVAVEAAVPAGAYARGLYLLHNFEYGPAAAAGRRLSVAGLEAASR